MKYSTQDIRRRYNAGEAMTFLLFWGHTSKPGKIKKACLSQWYPCAFAVDGVRYHHIIDKDTLFPSEHFASITVVTKDSGLADALSTALFCMSYEEGAALLEKLGDADALWVRSDGEMQFTPGMSRYIIEE